MIFIDFMFGLGIFQGASLLFVLLSLKGPKQGSNLIMSIMIFVLILFLAHNWLIHIGYFLTSPALSLGHLPLDYLVGPLLYFYGLSLTHHKFQKKQLLHFIPAALAIVPLLIFLTIPVATQISITKYIWYEEFAVTNVDISQLFWSSVWDFWIRNSLQGTAFVVHMATYCILLLFVIKTNRARLKTHYSSIEEKDLNWLRNLNIALIGYLAIFLFFNRIPVLFTTQNDPINFYPNLALVVIIQIIGLVSLRQPNLIHGRKAVERAEEIAQLTKSDVIDNVSDENELFKQKYKHSGLSMEVAQEYRIHVMNVMKDKQLYLECELTLNDLAAESNIPQHQLSEVLNGQLNQNFYSFVNNYRVQYAKELLTNEKTKNMAIVELAFEAGFRSKSSFYDAFKKATLLTPTQYKKQHNEQ